MSIPTRPMANVICTIVLILRLLPSGRKSKGRTLSMDVYALGDPRTGQVRYVGITRKMYKRYAQHFYEIHQSEQKKAWLEEIKNAGLVPMLTILETDIDESIVREREKYWIQYYLSLGSPLVNIQHVSVAPHEHEKERYGDFEDWISAHDSAQFLSLKHERPIPPSYVRQLAKSKKQPVRTRSLGYHQLYFKDDILAATV